MGAFGKQDQDYDDVFNPAGSTLARPHLGLKNGVHLNRILYVSSRTYPTVPSMLELGAGRANLRYVRGTTISPTGPGDLPLFKPPYGRITAIDLNQGAILWHKANGSGSPTVLNDPLLKGLELPPLGNGVDTLLVTKTLLICGQVSPGEQGDALLVARDKQTGDVVGAVPLPGRAIGSPMTYVVGDKQYLALTIRGSPPELIALSLPRVALPED